MVHMLPIDYLNRHRDRVTIRPIQCHMQRLRAFRQRVNSR